REWWTMVLQCKDQARQRMALALSEILVISEADQTILDRHYGCANYWDMLAAGAFGKYRTLLEQVTYSPMMGIYLSHMANRAAYDAGGGLIVSPDENYAREIMQLFSIGLVLRHPDGSLVLNQEGLPIPTYDQEDITELARVMTGWSHGARNSVAYGSTWNSTTLTWNHQTAQNTGGTVLMNGGSANSQWFGRQDGHLFFPTPWITPMKLVGRIGSTVYHDFTQYVDPDSGSPVAGVSKRLFAGKHGQYDIPMRTGLPVGTTYTDDQAYHAAAVLDMTEAHNALAGNPNATSYGAPGHQNTPVNISRWLIQRLVTSNPSAGYIYRVSSVYRASNGNLGEVFKAILLDYEARSLQLADSSISQGKVKEPLVHFAAMLRSLRAYSGAPVSLLRDTPPPFSTTNTPLPIAYPASEHDKFSTHNANPPSLPAGWQPGPFRYRFGDLTGNLGQSPQRAPSVFNWFLPDHTVPGPLSQAGLFAPELQIATESSEVAKVNYFSTFTTSNLVGMNAQPGTDSNVSDFVLSNNSATAAAVFTINGAVGNTLTFTPGNYNTEQTVTVTSINNSLLSNLNNGLLRFNVSGTGSGYENVVVPPEPLVVSDDEKPNEAILAVHTGFSTWAQEGGATDTVNVRLSAPPMAGSTVTVNVAANAGQVTVAPGTLNFNSSNWNTNQAVTVTAVNDGTSEAAGAANDTVTFTASSAASNYHGLTASLPVGVNDNDDGSSSYAVVIAESGGTTAVAETGNTSGTGTDSYTIVLTKQPSASVTVNVTASGGHVAVNTTNGGTTFTTGNATRTFTTSNWNTPQTVVVRGNDDGTAEGSFPSNPLHGGRITHSIATTVGSYTTSLPIQPVGVTIADNDNRIIISHVGNNETRVGENGVTDQITVALRTAPTVNVIVSLGSSSVRCEPAFVTFTPGNYNAAQTVTVSALDDFAKEGLQSAWNENVVPALATATATQTGGVATGVTITNGGAGYTAAPNVAFSGGGATSAATGIAHISADGVVTGVTITNGGAGYTSNPTVTFQAPPWGGGMIIASGTSVNEADGNYRNYWSAAHSGIPVTILDNDSAAVLATQSGGTTAVAEGGATDTYSLVLAQAPTADVTVQIAPVGTTAIPPVTQVATDKSSVTFTAANWNVPQVVTVSAVDDATVETDHSSLIYHTVQSTDPAYAGIQMTPLSVAISDNDFLGLTLSHLDGYTAVFEGGAAYPPLTGGSLTSGVIYSGDQFRVRLPLAPTANV
ncbi:MAG TPA: DUF1800 family protein, partial [Prosthecobacter sp.]|nr:DUF1800 family protein [Prosthecobacter sp.]